MYTLVPTLFGGYVWHKYHQMNREEVTRSKVKWKDISCLDKGKKNTNKKKHLKHNLEQKCSGM
jgi:hypothetical protein